MLQPQVSDKKGQYGPAFQMSRNWHAGNGGKTNVRRQTPPKNGSINVNKNYVNRKLVASRPFDIPFRGQLTPLKLTLEEPGP